METLCFGRCGFFCLTFCLCGCGSFLSGLLCSCSFSSGSCSLFRFGFLLCESFSPFLVHLGFSSLCSLDSFSGGFRDAFDLGVDLGIFIQGVGKRDYWGTGSVVIPGFNYLEAWYTHQLDYWTPDNRDAFYPALSNTGQSNQTQNFLPQTKYLLNMAYCRIKNITVGYTFPEKWTRKAKISKLRLYLSLENVFEFDHLGDIPIDPETRTSTGDGNYIGRSYPYSRNTSFGLQVTF